MLNVVSTARLRFGYILCVDALTAVGQHRLSDSDRLVSRISKCYSWFLVSISFSFFTRALVLSFSHFSSFFSLLLLHWRHCCSKFLLSSSSSSLHRRRRHHHHLSHVFFYLEFRCVCVFLEVSLFQFIAGSFFSSNFGLPRNSDTD